MDHPQQLELDGSHFSDSGRHRLADKIQGVGVLSCEMMNTKVGSRSSFLAFTPLLWERRLGGGGGGARIFFQPPHTDGLSRPDPRPTPSRLSSIRRLLQRVFTSDHHRVEDVGGSSREGIR